MDYQNLQMEQIPQTELEPKQSSRLSKKVLVIVISVLAIIIVAGGVWAFRGKIFLSKTTPTPSATPDETANWKTYTNNQYGFEFKYPADRFSLNIDSTSGYVALEDKALNSVENNAIISITRRSNPDKLSSYDYFVKYYQKDSVGTKSQFNGYDSVVFHGTEGAIMDFILVAVDSNAFIINQVPLRPDAAQILSTFKFTGEPITYPKDDKLFTVNKKSFKILDFLYNANTLASLSQECGTNLPESHFIQVLSNFSQQDTGIEYDFNYNGKSQEKGFTVWVVPNKVGYKNVADFKKDFDVCSIGGQYPSSVSLSNLLFVGSCGGVDSGSGLPSGCTEVQNFVVPTLKLN